MKEFHSSADSSHTHTKWPVKQTNTIIPSGTTNGHQNKVLFPCGHVLHIGVWLRWFSGMTGWGNRINLRNIKNRVVMNSRMEWTAILVGDKNFFILLMIFPLFLHLLRRIIHHTLVYLLVQHWFFCYKQRPRNPNVCLNGALLSWLIIHPTNRVGEPGLGMKTSNS